MAGYSDDQSQAQQHPLPERPAHEQPAPDKPGQPERRRRRSFFPWLLILLLLAMLFGVLTNPWFESQMRSRIPFLAKQAPASIEHAAATDTTPANTSSEAPTANGNQPHVAVMPQPDAALIAAETAHAAVDKDLADQLHTLASRFEALEQRSAAAIANSGRAEGMLLALAARRAVDTGQPLGVVEGMLRERFGGTQPQAVAALVAASQQPVTLSQLQASLQALEPQLQQAARSSNWMEELRDGLSQLIIIRRASAPTTSPVEQLRDARQRLLLGDVAGALWQVNRLPEDARNKASAWMVAARRYLAARQALDALETVALLAPPPGEKEQAIPLPNTPAAPSNAPSALN